jgi:hypothetical protein
MHITELFCTSKLSMELKCSASMLGEETEMPRTKKHCKKDHCQVRAPIPPLWFCTGGFHFLMKLKVQPGDTAPDLTGCLCSAPRIMEIPSSFDFFFVNCVIEKIYV